MGLDGHTKCFQELSNSTESSSCVVCLFCLYWPLSLHTHSHSHTTLSSPSLTRLLNQPHSNHNTLLYVVSMVSGVATNPLLVSSSRSSTRMDKASSATTTATLSPNPSSPSSPVASTLTFYLSQQLEPSHAATLKRKLSLRGMSIVQSSSNTSAIVVVPVFSGTEYKSFRAQARMVLGLPYILSVLDEVRHHETVDVCFGKRARFDRLWQRIGTDTLTMHQVPRILLGPIDNRPAVFSRVFEGCVVCSTGLCEEARVCCSCERVVLCI
jgi:hypothetical protein